MYKLLRFLSVVGLLASSMGQAFASTLEEDFVFSYSTNGSFTLSNLSYSSTSPPGPNLLTGLAPYTTFGGPISAGSGSLSEIISVDTTQTYVSNYSVSNFTGSVSSFSVSVSPVPLPASFPLFVMALLCLGLIGYYTARTNDRVAV